MMSIRETGRPGGTIDKEVAAFVNADAWTTDAMDGVRICQRVTAAT